MLLKQSQEKEKLRKNELKKKRVEAKRTLFCCKPEKKIKAKEDPSSSDSDVSMEIGHTSDDTDFLINSDEELQSLPKLHIDTKFNVGDFVLVKFHSKLASCYYIGQIIKSLEELEFEVKFLRRKDKSNTFVFPIVEDVSNVNRGDIVAFLSRADKNSTARTSSLFNFNYNFEEVNVR